MDKVKQHDILPSWNNQTYSVKVGEYITINDSNNILPSMKLESNNTNTSINVNGNSMIITPTANSNNGKITFNKVDKSYVGASIVYKKPKYQTVATMKLDSTKPASVNINVI